MLLSSFEGTLYSQSTTKLERMLNRQGCGLLTEIVDHSYYNNGLLGDLHFFVTIVTDFSNHEKIGGIILETCPLEETITAFAAKEAVYSSMYIDEDEIKSIIDWLNQFKSEYLKQKTQHFTEFIFSTRSGCTFKFTQNPNVKIAYKGKWAKWAFNVSTSGVLNSDFAYAIGDETVDNLILFFDKAKRMISEKTQ